MEVLQKWVINFDPSSLNNTDHGEGFDFLKEKTDGKQLYEYTTQLMKDASAVHHTNITNVPANF